MKCPNDGVELRMAERQGVEIDYCPECRGVWLDRGELDKIIDRVEQATTQPATPPQGYQPPIQPQAPYGNERYRGDWDDDHERRKDPRYGGYSDYGDYRHRKKRGGLLGELFDFD
jgi:hypothetical protein